MSKLSNLIKAILLLSVISTKGYTQCAFPILPNVPPGGANNFQAATFESKNGWYLPCSGTLRVLVIFAEIDYDLTPGNDPVPNGTPGWAVGQLPTWASNLFDHTTPGAGRMSRYFNEASSGNFAVLGDYLDYNNGGIFTVKESNGFASISALANEINTVMPSFVTVNGFTNASDFDIWTKQGPGIAKITPSIDNPHLYDHIMFIWRNIIGNNGVGYASPGGTGTNFLGYDADTYSYFGTYEYLPFDIARHEFAHLMYGGNNFHCGGGGTGPDNYFIKL